MATVLLIGNGLHDVAPLFKSKGHDVLTCPCVSSGFREAIQQCPECILILDVECKDLTSKLKSNIYTESIPVVVASNDINTRTDLFALGIYDFIQLPATTEHIAATCMPAIELGLLQRLVTRVMNRLYRIQVL